MEERSRGSGARIASSDLEDRPKANGVRLKKERDDSSGSATPNDANSSRSVPVISPNNNNNHEGNSASAADDAPTPETAPPPKMSRKSSSKMAARSPPQLFNHLPDATAEACSTFQVITDCLYGSKNMGSSDHDAFDCDCAEDWRESTPLPSPHMPFASEASH